ncbi:MAG: ATP-binding protein [Bacillota bacterium]|nr:ATP-binding protein [Bacillota bacterium]
MFKSIRLRMIIYSLVVIAVVVAVLGLFFSWFLHYFYMQTLRDNLYIQARLAATLVEEMIEEESLPLSIDRLYEDLGAELGIRMTLIAADGSVLADSDENTVRMENHGDRPEIIEASREGLGIASRYSATLQEDMYYLAVPLQIEETGTAADNSNSPAIIRLALPLSAINQAMGNLRLFIIGVLFVAFLLASGAAIILSRKITEPIGKISDASRAIAGGNFSPPLEVGGQDELAELASNIKVMGRSLAGQIGKVTAEKNKLETVVDSISSGIILTDREMKIELINPAAEKLFDLKSSEMIGVPLRKGLRYFNLSQSLKAVHDDGRSRIMELDLYYPRAAVLETYLLPVTGAAGEMIGVLLLFHEVTQLRTIEKMRSDFVANVSHELRTPLTVVRGYTETIMQENLSRRELMDFLQIINRETERLADLLDNLLDLAQIENEKGLVRKKPINLKSLIEEAVDHVEELGKQRGTILKTDLPDNEVVVEGNHEWLSQALINILENSIRHGRENGMVTVELICKQQTAFVEVTDDGPGIPENDLPYIFERFYRVDKARSRKSGGTGLGLSIVKHIMEAHGADYQLLSTEGTGTVFRFSLPCCKS